MGQLDSLPDPSPFLLALSVDSYRPFALRT